jgi:hypothetical protein
MTFKTLQGIIRMTTRAKTATKKSATKKAKAATSVEDAAKEAKPAAKKEATSVKISEAKGRPMLHWVGKKPLESVQSFPAQLVETFSPPPPATLMPLASRICSFTATIKRCWRIS